MLWTPYIPVIFRPAGALDDMCIRSDGLHPSLMYSAASRLLDYGCFVTMGFAHRWCIAPLRGFLIRGIIYRWASPIADILRRFAAVDYGVVYRWATPIAFVFRRFAALDLGYPVYDGLR